MNIVYYCGLFPKLSESFVLNEIYELDRRGHNVAVFAVNDPKEDFHHDELENLDIPIHYAEDLHIKNMKNCLSHNFVSLDGWKSSFISSNPIISFYEGFLGSQFADFIDNLNFEVEHIHSHFASPDKLGGLYGARSKNCSFSVAVHAIDIFASDNHNITNKILNESNRIVAASEYNKKYILSNYKFNTPVDVVYATSSFKKFSNIERNVCEGRILTVGRLVEKKGIKYGLRAFNQLLDDDYESLNYHIVGDGELKDEIEEEIKELDLSDSVKLLGAVSDERLMKEYSEADIFLLPCVIAEDGDRDAMPVVLKEAMSVGIPCISTNISAIPELIEDGNNGLLSKPQDVNSLYENIRTLLEDEKNKLEIGQKGIRTVEKISIEREVDKLIKSFRSASN